VASPPCVPSMGDGLGVEVPRGVGRSDSSEPQGADREGSTERSGVANPTSRRTEIGYEAVPSRASGHVTAKLSRPKLRCCKSGGCSGKVVVLTWGDLALRLKGRHGRELCAVEREVSRGRSSYDCAAGAGSGEGPNVEESHRTRISSGTIGRCPETELPSEHRGEAPRVRRSVASQSARSGNGAQGGRGTGPTSTLRTAVYGPVRTVVGEGSSRDHRLPPIPIVHRPRERVQRIPGWFSCGPSSGVPRGRSLCGGRPKL
jgi:hypothetical protein